MMMGGTGCGVCALPLLYRYVSGYKNRYQNFIRYLRELGDEVSNRFCWRCALKLCRSLLAIKIIMDTKKKHVELVSCLFETWESHAMVSSETQESKTCRAWQMEKELLDKISCTCLLQSIIHVFFSGFAGPGCHYTCRCACRVLRCQGDWFLEVGHLQHRIVIIWCLSFIFAWSL